MEGGYYHYTLRILLIHVYLAANSINQIEMSKNTQQHQNPLGIGI